MAEEEKGEIYGSMPAYDNNKNKSYLLLVFTLFNENKNCYICKKNKSESVM